MFKFFLTKLFVICSVVLCQLLAMDFDEDSRHKFVRGIQQQYAKDIEIRRQRLNTNRSDVALIDFARECLEHEITTSTNSGTDWSLVINCVISGYGYRDGVSKTTIATPSEVQVMRLGYMLSATCQIATGNSAIIELTDIYSPDKGSDLQLSGYVRELNEIASFVPKEIHELGAKHQMIAKNRECEESQKREQSLKAQQHSDNVWHAHERFYGVAGVINPQTSDALRDAFDIYKGSYKSSNIGFVGELAQKLDAMIKSTSGNPQPQAVVNLVQLSQQILMTLSAGVAGKDSNFVRLAPSNQGDWETIRKALFLALSVTSNPAIAGNTFLSTLYDCGRFYHQKTDPDLVKAYYWRLEAYAKGFSAIWNGEKQPEHTIKTALNFILEQAEPLSCFLGDKRPNTQLGSSYPIIKKAHEEAVASISIGGAKAELSASFALHPKLKHDYAFRALYPDLTAQTTYHTPSPTAAKLMMGKLVKLQLPQGFQPQAIHLSYQGGKWYLKALRLDSSGKVINEEVIWTQTGTKDSLVGSLTDAQGTHIFNVSVNGATAIVKAISSGYMVRVGGVGTTTIVANDKELGIIESSARPLHPDIATNKEDSAILIEGEGYYGKRGVLSAQWDSVWVQAPTIIRHRSKATACKRMILLIKDSKSVLIRM